MLPPSESFYGTKCLTNTVNYRKSKNVKNVHIVETTASIPTKFCSLHSDIDNQMPFMGGPNRANTRIPNPRCRMAAILEKSKNCHISATVWAISTTFGTMTQFDPLDCSDRCKFEILKIQHGGGRHLEKSNNRHISAVVWAILTKFGTMSDAVRPSWPLRLKN